MKTQNEYNLIKTIVHWNVSDIGSSSAFILVIVPELMLWEAPALVQIEAGRMYITKGQGQWKRNIFVTYMKFLDKDGVANS